MINERYFFKTGRDNCSNYYVFSDKTEDRLHYLFNHPKLEILNRLRNKYEVSLLKDICAEPIHRGEQPKYEEDGDVIVIKTVDLKNFYIDYENCLKVSRAFFDKFPAAQVRKGDILIASTGYVSMGKVDIYDRNEPAVVDGHISVLRLRDDYDPHFVVHFLRSHLGQLQFEKWFSGSSGQIEIQPTDIGQFIMPQSSDKGINIKIQNKTATIITRKLKESFDLEQKAKKIRRDAEEILLTELDITLLKEEKVDYYTYLFDNLENRFGYGNYHPSVKQLEDALKKARYKIKPIIELINIKYDSIEPSKNPDKEYYYIGLENIESNTGRLKSILNLMGKEISSKSNMFKKGQLLYSGLRPYLNKCFILEDYDDAIGSAELFICEAKEGVSLHFLKWYLLSEVTLRQTKWILSGASYPRLDEDDFLNLKIVIPDDPKEQLRIVKAVESMIKEAEKSEQKAKETWNEAKDIFENLIFK